MLMSESNAGKLSSTPQVAHGRELFLSSDASSSSAMTVTGAEASHLGLLGLFLLDFPLADLNAAGKS